MSTFRDRLDTLLADGALFSSATHGEDFTLAEYMLTCLHAFDVARGRLDYLAYLQLQLAREADKPAEE